MNINGSYIQFLSLSSWQMSQKNNRLLRKYPRFCLPPLNMYLHLPSRGRHWLTQWPHTISLTHWGRVTHICVSKLTIIDPDNGVSPGRRQAIIWTNAGILLMGPLGTKLNQILIEIHTFSFKKMHLKMSSAKWRPFCLGPNVLIVRFTA